MITGCLDRYSKAGVDCDRTTNYLCSSCDPTGDGDRNVPYLSKTRITAALYFASGACCCMVSPSAATTLCCLPATVVLAASEMPTSAICILNVFKRTASSHNPLESKSKDPVLSIIKPQDFTRSMSARDREFVAVDLSRKDLVGTPPSAANPLNEIKSST
jgi:hypothetical protein